MNLLTTNNGTELDQINLAMTQQGYPELGNESEFRRLGEGAWHYAYLLQPLQDLLVLRIPKKVAYGSPVVFNKSSLIAEYAATKAYYGHANQAMKGICPELFEFHVSEELTYTIESYVGETIPIKQLSSVDSYRYGSELGEFFLAKETLETPIGGLGSLVWKEGVLKGQLDWNVHDFIRQETDEYRDELDTLLGSELTFDKEIVARTGRELLENRAVDSEKIVLTNQDTSPENLIFSKQRVHLIDPYPILYTGTSLAANHIFNYHTLFPTFHDTPRYERHHFNLYHEQMNALSKGFIDGYVQSSEEKSRALQVEVYIKLMTMIFTHYELLKGPTNREHAIRYGSKDQIEIRMKKLLLKLETFPVLN